MAKRFTDSDKWKKQWFRCLPPTWKCFWIYVCDNCDHAGIWDVDLDLASFQIGAKLESSKVSEILGKQILEISNGKKWFIIDFIDFQYGELKSNNNAHASVINILTRFGLWDFYVNRNNLAPCEPLNSPLVGALDMDMDKEMDKDMKGDARGKQKIFERIDVWFENLEFTMAWDAWEEMRKASKSKPTEYAKNLAFTKLKGLAGDDLGLAIQIVNAATESNWKTFYQLKGNQNGKTCESGTDTHRHKKRSGEFSESLSL
jgi:hypothetical protein